MCRRLSVVIWFPHDTYRSHHYTRTLTVSSSYIYDYAIIIQLADGTRTRLDMTIVPLVYRYTPNCSREPPSPSIHSYIYLNNNKTSPPPKIRRPRQCLPLPARRLRRPLRSDAARRQLHPAGRPLRRSYRAPGPLCRRVHRLRDAAPRGGRLAPAAPEQDGGERAAVCSG